MREILSFAFALEDVFALYLTGFAPGFFLDIGCGHPHVGSNSMTLESRGWKGIGIDLKKNKDWDSQRATKCLSADATLLDYRELLELTGAPRVIDLLSIDVEDACYDALRGIPFSQFEFKIVLIENDAYRTNALRTAERILLNGQGYSLICSDVMHEPGKPFEDWWVKQEFFEQSLIFQIRSDNELDIDIIRKFGQKNSIVRMHGYYGDYPQMETA